MNLDHYTGTMEGTILRGPFAGMRLEEAGVAVTLSAACAMPADMRRGRTSSKPISTASV